MTVWFDSSRWRCRCMPASSNRKDRDCFIWKRWPHLAKIPLEVEKAMYAEVEKVQKGPIQEWELEKARNAARRSLVGNLRSSLQRAILLARYAVFFDDPGIINTRYERIASLKIDDLQRVARQYIVPTNRTVAITVPAKKDAPAAGGAK